jgi:hypothetical protein
MNTALEKLNSDEQEALNRYALPDHMTEEQMRVAFALERKALISCISDLENARDRISSLELELAGKPVQSVTPIGYALEQDTHYEDRFMVYPVEMLGCVMVGIYTQDQVNAIAPNRYGSES